ncbi:MAG: response regulator [Bacteroidales bacterium]|jgi:DNA-binding response OmpR family regulator
MNPGKRNVLIIENDAIIALDIKKRFEDIGFKVVGTPPSFNDMFENLNKFRNVDLILLDTGLSDFAQMLSVAEKVYKCVNTPLILLSTRVDEFIKRKSEQYESVKIIEKPFNMEELMNTAGNVLQMVN